MTRTTDLDLSDKDISGLTSVDTLMSFLGRMGYETDARTALTPEAVGLSGDSAASVKTIELLSEDSEQFLRVVFAQPRSMTAKLRTDLVRALGKSTVDHMLILSPDFETLEFVLIDKPKSERKGQSSVTRRPPAQGPIGCSGGKWWATVSKNSSGMRALGMAVVSSKVKGYRGMAQTRCRRVLSDPVRVYPES